MKDVWVLYTIIPATVICMVVMVVKEVKATRRQAPDGKVFVKEFAEMITDIYDAICRLKTDRNINFIAAHIKGRTFKVGVTKEVPYEGLKFETIPYYKSYAIYFDDELVCREHTIESTGKKKVVIEFSSKRERKEILEILQYAHVVANEYNHEYFTNLFSKYNSKSFYNEE